MPRVVSRLVTLLSFAFSSLTSSGVEIFRPYIYFLDIHAHRVCIFEIHELTRPVKGQICNI